MINKSYKSKDKIEHQARYIEMISAKTTSDDAMRRMNIYMSTLCRRRKEKGFRLAEKDANRYAKDHVLEQRLWTPCKMEYVDAPEIETEDTGFLSYISDKHNILFTFVIPFLLLVVITEIVLLFVR